MKLSVLFTMTTLAAATLWVSPVQTQVVFTRAIVAERIKQVENGVDEFRKYLEHRGEDTKERVEAADSSGSSRRRTAASTNAVQKDRAKDTKDALDDALGDLNRATNRLRRKFDPTDKWIETKAEVQRVMDEARDANQIMTRGQYGTQAEKYWAALRKSINELAACYGLAPMGV